WRVDPGAILELGQGAVLMAGGVMNEMTGELGAKIKVVGVGGGGGNALNTMILAGLTGVDFIAANTDCQALQHNRAATKIQLGAMVTKGLGAGANPEIGRQAALEDREKLAAALEGADMVFVTAGMGGGTGTGGAPIIADIARGVGALTVGVVTKPFMFEGKRRLKQADHGIAELKNTVDTLITIPNQRLLAVADEKTTLLDTFKKADEVLLNAVQGISDLITIPGLINVDFADVRTIMSNMGVALMGSGTATGETRAMVAARAAVESAGEASDDGPGRTASRGAAADAGDPPRGDASSGSAAGDAGASAEAGAAPLVGRAAAAHRSVGGRAGCPDVPAQWGVRTASGEDGCASCDGASRCRTGGASNALLSPGRGPRGIRRCAP